ncbi:alpha/beta hydrolase [Salisaeta longa]|uniref:alpha/beta hydrolase n=1 Tax=Salisaeta longa TaxID=503170 RepID=UPI0003B44446|nr:alpha/beta hydrolase [Salisaeta longa]
MKDTSHAPAEPYAPTDRGTHITRDGLRLFTQQWVPPAPRASVVFVHGYAEHSSRYDDLARYLNAEGYAVYTYDHRGFGRSGGPRALMHSAEPWLDDLQEILQRPVLQQAPGPLFLMGHSMGGALVLAYALRETPALDGLVLSSPAIAVPAPGGAIGQTVAQWVGRWLPRLPTVGKLHDALSHDPAVRERVARDPLCYQGRVPAATGATLLRLGQRLQATMHALTLPFYAFHGTADIITKPAGTQRLYDTAASTDKTLKLYEGLYHETLHEYAKDAVRADLLNWLNDRVGD